MSKYNPETFKQLYEIGGAELAMDYLEKHNKPMPGLDDSGQQADSSFPVRIDSLEHHTPKAFSDPRVAELVKRQRQQREQVQNTRKVSSDVDHDIALLLQAMSSVAEGGLEQAELQTELGCLYRQSGDEFDALQCFLQAQAILCDIGTAPEHKACNIVADTDQVLGLDQQYHFLYNELAKVSPHRDSQAMFASLDELIPNNNEH